MARNMAPPFRLASIAAILAVAAVFCCLVVPAMATVSIQHNKAMLSCGQCTNADDCSVCRHDGAVALAQIELEPTSYIQSHARVKKLHEHHNAVHKQQRRRLAMRQGAQSDLQMKESGQAKSKAKSGLTAYDGSTDTEMALAEGEAKVELKDIRDNQYIGQLTVGTSNPPQTVNLIFDTGSTNLWVVGADCKSHTCRDAQKFDQRKSTSFKWPSPEVELEITFGTGSISGDMGIDNFGLGPFTVKNQTFGMVEEERGDNGGNIFEEIKFEGILGLAFPAMSSEGVTPFFDNIMNQGILKNNEFSFYFSSVQDDDSAVFFGGVNTSYFEPPVRMLEVTKEHYWQVKLDELTVGNTKVCCDEGENASVIFDTGTSFNTVPSDEMATVLGAIGSSGDCTAAALDSLPDITYTMSGVKVTLTGRDYMVHSTSSCKPGYMSIDVPRDFGRAYLLGDVFMRHFYTVFSRGKNGGKSRVGIAKAKRPTDTHSKSNAHVSTADPASAIVSVQLQSAVRVHTGNKNKFLH